MQNSNYLAKIQKKMRNTSSKGKNFCSLTLFRIIIFFNRLQALIILKTEDFIKAENHYDSLPFAILLARHTTRTLSAAGH